MIKNILTLVFLGVVLISGNASKTIKESAVNQL